MEKRKNGECELKQKKEKYATKPESFYSKSFLIGPDLRTVSEGSALHVQQGAMSSLGLSLAGLIWAVPRSSAKNAW